MLKFPYLFPGVSVSIVSDVFMEKLLPDPQRKRTSAEKAPTTNNTEYNASTKEPQLS
jgi:hypothetical protein